MLLARALAFPRHCERLLQVAVVSYLPERKKKKRSTLFKLTG
jgi:hypothetical protein